jgi:hypothetical protein
MKEFILDFHQVELQLFVTQSYTTYARDVIFSVLYSGSWILLSNPFSCGILSALSICLLQIFPCSVLIDESYTILILSCLVDESLLYSLLADGSP